MADYTNNSGDANTLDDNIYIIDPNTVVLSINSRRHQEEVAD